MRRGTKSVEGGSRYGACQQDIAQNPVTLVPGWCQLISTRDQLTNMDKQKYRLAIIGSPLYIPEKSRQIIPTTGDSIE